MYLGTEVHDLNEPRAKCTCSRGFFVQLEVAFARERPAFHLHT